MKARQDGTVLILALGCAALVGCTNSSSKNDAGDADAAMADAGPGIGSQPVACLPGALESSDFHLGLMASGAKGKIFAKLVAADQVPPVLFNNTWTVEFMDAQGAPLADVQVTHAEAAMPLHTFHLPKPATSIKMLAEPGQFEIGLFLRMIGYFELNFDVTSPTAGDDRITYKYCLR